MLDLRRHLRYRQRVGVLAVLGAFEFPGGLPVTTDLELDGSPGDSLCGARSPRVFVTGSAGRSRPPVSLAITLSPARDLCAANARSR